MRRFPVIIVILFIFCGCKSNQDVEKNCLTVSDMVTPSECYDQKKGLTLTASNVAESTELDWVIGPLKDTLGGTYVTYNQSTKSNSIVIPDSIISGYPFVDVVYVAIKNCSAPIYFRFARRVTMDSACTTWYLKEKGVKGD